MPGKKRHAKKSLSDDEQAPSRRSARVKCACDPCRANHISCDSARPCGACVRRGEEAECLASLDRKPRTTRKVQQSDNVAWQAAAAALRGAAAAGWGPRPPVHPQMHPPPPIQQQQLPPSTSATPDLLSLVHDAVRAYQSGNPPPSSSGDDHASPAQPLSPTDGIVPDTDPDASAAANVTLWSLLTPGFDETEMQPPITTSAVTMPPLPPSQDTLQEIDIGGFAANMAAGSVLEKLSEQQRQFMQSALAAMMRRLPNTPGIHSQLRELYVEAVAYLSDRPDLEIGRRLACVSGCPLTREPAAATRARWQEMLDRQPQPAFISMADSLVYANTPAMERFNFRWGELKQGRLTFWDIVPRELIVNMARVMFRHVFWKPPPVRFRVRADDGAMLYIVAYPVLCECQAAKFWVFMLSADSSFEELSPV